MNMRKNYSKATPLLRAASIFGVAGLVMAGLGIAGMLNVIRGGIGAAILAFVAAALGLGVACSGRQGWHRQPCRLPLWRKGGDGMA